MEGNSSNPEIVDTIIGWCVDRLLDVLEGTGAFLEWWLGWEHAGTSVIVVFLAMIVASNAILGRLFPGATAWLRSRSARAPRRS